MLISLQIESFKSAKADLREGFTMKNMDAASISRLNETVAYLRDKSGGRLAANLYQKILFLIELNHYREHQNLFVGLEFKSLKYGPFSEAVAVAVDAPDAKTSVSIAVQERVDEVLEEFGLAKFTREEMQNAYTAMSGYISKLYIYNITPFEFALDFAKYNFADLFETLEFSQISGEDLEREAINSPLIRQEAKRFEYLF